MGRLITDDEAIKLDGMLRKLATKKIRMNQIKMDFEDLVSELWINALTIIEKTETIDYNYIAAASFNHIVDLVRKNVRTEYSCFTNEDLDRCVKSDALLDRTTERQASDSKHVYTYCSNSSHQKSIESIVDINMMLQLFEDGSKEYKFIKAWMELMGIVEPEDVSNFPETCAYDRFVAVTILGYASSHSNGYMNVKKKVRKILSDAGYTVFIEM